MPRGIAAIVEDTGKFNHSPVETVEDEVPRLFDGVPGNTIPAEHKVVNPGICCKVVPRFRAWTTGICMKVAQGLPNECSVTIRSTRPKSLFAQSQGFPNVLEDRRKVERR